MPTSLQPSAAYGLVAQRWGSFHLRSHHNTLEEASQALSRVIDLHPLQVMPIDLVLAANGNVRIWNRRVENQPMRGDK